MSSSAKDLSFPVISHLSPSSHNEDLERKMKVCKTGATIINTKLFERENVIFIVLSLCLGKDRKERILLS